MLAIRAMPRLLWSRLLWLILYGETLVPRCILSIVAAIWAVLLFLPGETFIRPAYSLMAVVASENSWAWAWIIYAVASTWRTFSETKHRTVITLIVNGFGLVLYATTTACILLSRLWPAPAAMAGDFGMSLVALWLFMRSGLNNPPGWRDD